MIAFEAVLSRIQGLEAAELKEWIAARWVLPEQATHGYAFHDIDVARIHLIVELRRELLIDAEAMPLVLNLLDQVYALRKRLKSVAAAIEKLPPDMQVTLRGHLGD
jgi:chaperone modulatory protein CbpM